MSERIVEAGLGKDVISRARGLLRADLATQGFHLRGNNYNQELCHLWKGLQANEREAYLEQALRVYSGPKFGSPFLELTGGPIQDLHRVHESHARTMQRR